MSVESDNFATALNQLSALIVTLTASQNPTYTLDDGTTVQKTEYLQMLIQQRQTLKIAYVDALGPYEVRTVGF